MLRRLIDWFSNLFIKTDVVLTAKTEFIAEASRDHRWNDFKNKLVAGKKCAICGSVENLTGHHKKPFFQYPELELDPANIEILCENPSRNCHFIFGHLMNWRTYNDDLDNTIAYFQLLRNRARIRLKRHDTK
jgi:5-methylcytosine-specific restriction protein A